MSRHLDGLWEDEHQGLVVVALQDGDDVSPWESVMHITGDASAFLHLETVYLGLLARRTRIATSVGRVVEVGLATDYCVKETVLDALRHGLQLTIVPEGLRAVNANPDDGDNAIKEMRSQGARLVKLAEVTV